MEFGWISLWGTLIIVIMMVPNLIYARKSQGEENNNSNLALSIIEQVGRYASMLLMVVPIGVWKFGFSSTELLLVYLLGNAALLTGYLVGWIFYFRRRTFWRGMLLAILPAGIFLLSGLCLKHCLLVGAALIFALGHITITYRNHRR